MATPSASIMVRRILALPWPLEVFAPRWNGLNNTQTGPPIKANGDANNLTTACKRLVAPAVEAERRVAAKRRHIGLMERPRMRCSSGPLEGALEAYGSSEHSRTQAANHRRGAGDRCRWLDGNKSLVSGEVSASSGLLRSFLTDFLRREPRRRRSPCRRASSRRRSRRRRGR